MNTPSLCQTTRDALATLTSRTARTDTFIAWLTQQDDEVKARYAINWRIPHSVFNVSCRFFPGELLQNIDWYHIFKTGAGNFSHGGPVVTPARMG